MILTSLKRVMKALLSATEEWLLETGVPRETIDEARPAGNPLRRAGDASRQKDNRDRDNPG